MNAGLPPLVVSGRSDRIRASFVDVDALIVSDLVNIRWLTGFTGSNGWLLMLPDRDVLVTDRRYGDQASAQARGAGAEIDVLVGGSASEMMTLSVGALANLGRIGVEAHHMTIGEHGRWTAALADAVGRPVVVPTDGVVAEGRRTKDDAEIARIERSAVIAAQALTATFEVLRGAPEKRVTERDVRDIVEGHMRDLGADGPGYETIVATGPVNASLPHHRPDHTALQAGDTLIIDVGAAIDGYRSDMTRSYVVGEPSSRHMEMYGAVLRAQEAGLAAVRPGAACRDVDAACRDLLVAEGLGDLFRHGTGHGVGLVIHEDPFVNSSSEMTLRVGDVVTVEPGVYREGFGGFRIEDLVVVTADGCRNLTPLAKDSPCLPSPPTT